MAQMCGALYKRTLPGGKFTQDVYCSFIRDHAGLKHSWNTLQLQDECDAEAEKTAWKMSADIPSDIVALIEGITSGVFDDSLEYILAAAHGRKRTRHGRQPDYRVTR